MNSNENPQPSTETEDEFFKAKDDIIKLAPFFKLAPSDALHDAYQNPATVGKLEAAIRMTLDLRRLCEDARTELYITLQHNALDDVIIKRTTDFLVARTRAQRSDHLMAVVMKATRTPDEYIRQVFPNGLPS